MKQNNYYYSQGFRFSRSVSTVDFIQTLNEVKVTGGSRIKVYFKPGTKTEDYENLDLPSSVYVDSNKTLKPRRNLQLTAKKLKFNNHLLYIYDLDDRVVNYIVSEEQDSAMIEDPFSTSWVVNKNTVTVESQLKDIIEKSKYIFWENIPCNEYYSYRYVNTATAVSVDETNGEKLPTVVAKHNNPINFSKYTKWRLEYATVLIGFYDLLQTQLDDRYSIYMDGKKIKCLDSQSSRRIDVSLQGFGNLNRHAYVYDHDLYQTKAEMSVKIQTPDQLEFMHLKKKYQNYEFLSDLVRFDVDDKIGLPWTNHIWWEPFRDSTQMRGAKDDQGRLSYTLDLQCSIHFYEVEDAMYHTINQIRVVFENLPEKPEYVYKVNNPSGSLRA